MVGITTQAPWSPEEAQQLMDRRLRIYLPILVISATIGWAVLILLVYHRKAKPFVARGPALMVFTVFLLTTEKEAN